ncbi:hypothetical protein JCM10207_000669 [Rhodosporidiobolus poonsookiae]
MPQPWGRLLIAGGTDFAVLGRKDKSGKNTTNLNLPDLASAHIVRKVANVKFKRVITSHSGCHAVALSVDGQAYLLGRNDHHQLSHPLPAEYTTMYLDSKDLPSKTPPATEPFALRSLPDKNVPAALKKQRIVQAACGRSHTVLVTSKGEAWTAGWNNYGQCGHPESTEHISAFKRVKGDLADEKVVQASAGISHTLFLTESGKVYAVGTGEKGVLGNGVTGEHIAGSKVLFLLQSEPLLVEGALEGKKIVQITSGQQHNIALDDEGYCYAWGFGGLGRLGLGAQQDVLVPVQIPQFAGANVLTRAKKIAAGSTNTLFIDNQNMVLLCGKWKTSGDGSAGQPWMTPRSVHELQGFKFDLISAGGVTLFGHAHDPKDGDLTVAWGQNANYRELALGEGSSKSATKPARIDYLDGIEILDIAAGQATTFFLARPPPTQADKDAVKAPVVPPAPAAAPASPAAAEPATAAGAGAAPKPAVDLSGFGFSFMPSPAGSAASTPPPPPAAPAKAAAPTERTVSRTQQAAWEELMRWPDVPPEELAESCKECGGVDTEGPKGEMLECEKCEGAYHLGCLSPPLTAIPDGEWFCASCGVEPEPFSDEEDEADAADAAGGKKRKADEDEAVTASKKQK